MDKEKDLLSWLKSKETWRKVRKECGHGPITSKEELFKPLTKEEISIKVLAVILGFALIAIMTAIILIIV